jgi:2-oxo-4-hydroxy-4-carboxy--5-ureidoimidazoline (OHCU) decarboxylase
VKGAPPGDILRALRKRLASDRDAEHAEALRQVSKIARFRLAQMFEEELP